MWYWLPALVIALLALAVVLLIVLRPRTQPEAMLRELFHGERTRLEDRFFQAAAASGKPRGLRWTRCEWGNAFELARDRKTGQFFAFVSVTISFEAVEGSDMEGLPAVGNLRNASAVFFFDGVRWDTAGRAVFNLNPDEAIQHFASQYEQIVSPKR